MFPMKKDREAPEWIIAALVDRNKERKEHIAAHNRCMQRQLGGLDEGQNPGE